MRWHAALLAMMVLVAGGCNLDRRDVGDLEAVKERGELRVAVRPGFSSSPVGGAGAIDERELLIQLAGRLGVVLRVTEVPRNDVLLTWLEEGRCDLAVGRFSPLSLRPELSPSAAVDWVEDLFVTSVRSGIEHLDEVEGRVVHLHRSVEEWLLKGSGLELRVAPIPEEVSCEEVVSRVASGRYWISVVDSGLLASLATGRDLRVLGPVDGRRALVWTLRRSNLRLRAAVDDFLFAEQVLGRSKRVAACRDLEQIREAGVLRVITRNSPTTCAVARGGLEGFEYELALGFAFEIGARLELSIPPPGADPMQWLEHGYGDLVALHEPAAPRDAGCFRSTYPYRHVDLVAVALSDRVPRTVDDLCGRRVIASRPIRELCQLLPLDPPIEWASHGLGQDVFAALAQMSRGKAEIALMDSDAVRLKLGDRPDLGTGVVVLRQVPLVWQLNPGAEELHEAVSSYLERSTRSGLGRQLALKNLSDRQPYVPESTPEAPPGALSPFDEVLKWAGRRHGIDWRLLASVMYEESRFDPDAVGAGGSAGLFQLMPFTWHELGVEDPHHPGEAIDAGARYLRKLMGYFEDLPMSDSVAMAVASFNVGPRHVFDARKLAAEMNLDPDRWAGVETALAILDDPEVARSYPAGVCQCRRAVSYTRRILRRYWAYTEQFPPS
jgi:membrane-bound lytic murein transglycosylase F